MMYPDNLRVHRSGTSAKQNREISGTRGVAGKPVTNFDCTPKSIPLSNSRKL